MLAQTKSYQEFYSGTALAGTSIGNRIATGLSFNYNSGIVYGSYSTYISAKVYTTIKSPYSGTVTFSFTWDDGWSIYIDDSQKSSYINKEIVISGSFSMTLVANRYYTVYVEWCQYAGGNLFTISWLYPGVSTVIPNSNVYLSQLVGSSPYTTSVVTSIWGDGYKTGTEAWDDANTSSGDGCSSSCTIESGYMWTGSSTTTKDTWTLWAAGFYQQGTTSPNSWVTQWGDGKLAGTEACDDANINNGDGWSSSWTIESGYKWIGGSTTSKDTWVLCTAGFYQQGSTSPNTWVTQCGDGKLAGTEACDDQNVTNGDGWSSSWTIESGYKWAGGSTTSKDTWVLWTVGFYQQGTTSPNSWVTQCGDGKLAGTEACDDQNVNNGDGWSSSWTIESGYKWTGGSTSSKDTWTIWTDGFYQQGTTSPNSWVTQCGDGKLAGTEACDDQNVNNGDGWSSTCSIESGYKWSGGSTISKDTWVLWTAGFYQQGSTSPNSWVTQCGDGKLAGTEACDDQNVNNGDGCNSSWIIENGYMWAGGSTSSKDTWTICAAGFYQQGTTSPNSWVTHWGDGLLAGTEAWDDQNINNGDGWSSTCSIESGYKWTGGSTTSKDTWVLCTAGFYQQGTTSPNSWVTQCGDGKLAGTEACDDQNVTNGDGWSSSWTIESGYKWTGGSTSSKDTWTIWGAGFYQQGTTSPNSWVTHWGDGLLAGTEAWDDANVNNGDGWSSSWTIESGYKWTGGSTTTKDTWALWTAGFYQQGIASPNSCITRWGDGLLAGTEACDDSNTSSGDGCKSDWSAIEANYQCTGGSTSSKDVWSLWTAGFYQQGTTSPNSWVSKWGDGLRVGSESWDDGNTSNGDGCSSLCIVETDYSCSGGSTTSKDVCFRWYYYNQKCIQKWATNTYIKNSWNWTDWDSYWATWFGSAKSEWYSCVDGYTLTSTTWMTPALSTAASTTTAAAYSTVAVSSVSAVTSGVSSFSSATSAASSGASAGSAGTSSSPQLFWIMTNTYQIMMLFLLLKVNLHQSLIDMLESLSYSTFNFSFINFPYTIN